MMEIPGCKVEGEFDPQRFFNALALILSNRENCKITVKVTRKDEELQKQAV